VAAIVTPPDVVSQTIVAIPMLLIYEASIFISVLVTKNKKRIIMSAIIEEFNDYRSKMNEKLLADNNKIVKRIFNLDTMCMLCRCT
jgi:hypothetical protein